MEYWMVRALRVPARQKNMPFVRCLAEAGEAPAGYQLVCMYWIYWILYAVCLHGVICNHNLKDGCIMRLIGTLLLIKGIV